MAERDAARAVLSSRQMKRVLKFVVNHGGRGCTEDFKTTLLGLKGAGAGNEMQSM